MFRSVNHRQTLDHHGRSVRLTRSDRDNHLRCVDDCGRSGSRSLCVLVLGGARGRRLGAIGSFAAACRRSAGDSATARSVGAGHRDARCARHPDGRGATRARTSPGPPASCTHRTASFRWIWPAAARPASCGARRTAGADRRPPDSHAPLPRRGATRGRCDGPGLARHPRGLHAGVNSGLRRFGRRRSNTCCCGRSRSRGASRTACSSCCRCSSRCRIPTARTRRRSARCTTCCRRRWRTSSRRSAPSGIRRSSASALEVPPIPGPDVYDLRDADGRASSGNSQLPTPSSEPAPSRRAGIVESRHQGLGSWALGVGCAELGLGVDTRGRHRQQQLGGLGRLTADGRALVANDMHLTVRVPEHVVPRLARVAGRRRAATRHRLIGVTLPGVPAVVVGSNTHVAWGFTNSQGDWSDIVLLEVDPADPESLSHARGLARVRASRRDDRGRRRGVATSESIRWTIWGPVIGAGSQGTAARLPLGRARRRPPRHIDYRPRIGAARSKRRSTRSTDWERPARTSSWPTRRAESAGRSTDRSRGASASTAGARCHGPTARAAGAAGSTRRVSAGDGSRQAGASGRPTPASSTATCWPASATATTKSAHARASSANGSPAGSGSRPPTC